VSQMRKASSCTLSTPWSHVRAAARARYWRSEMSTRRLSPMLHLSPVSVAGSWPCGTSAADAKHRDAPIVCRHCAVRRLTPRCLLAILDNNFSQNELGKSQIVLVHSPNLRHRGRSPCGTTQPAPLPTAHTRLSNRCAAVPLPLSALHTGHARPRWFSCHCCISRYTSQVAQRGWSGRCGGRLSPTDLVCSCVLGVKGVVDTRLHTNVRASPNGELTCCPAA
jgi:hypothetical protein